MIHWECEPFFNQPLILLDDAKHSDRDRVFYVKLNAQNTEPKSEDMERDFWAMVDN